MTSRIWICHHSQPGPPTGSPNRVLLVVVDDTPRGRLVAGTLVETIEPLVGAIAATRACDLDDAISKKSVWKMMEFVSWDDDIPNILFIHLWDSSSYNSKEKS